jgi:hypothetical protein
MEPQRDQTLLCYLTKGLIMMLSSLHLIVAEQEMKFVVKKNKTKTTAKTKTSGTLRSLMSVRSSLIAAIAAATAASANTLPKCASNRASGNIFSTLPVSAVASEAKMQERAVF